MGLINAELESLNIPVIESFVNLGPLRSKKRKFNDFNEQDYGDLTNGERISAASTEVFGIKDPTYLTIADRNIVAVSNIPRDQTEEAPAEVGKVLELDDVGLKFQDSTLTILTKTRQKLVSSNVVSLKIRNEEFNKVGVYEMKFLKNFKLRHQPSVQTLYPKVSIKYLNVEQDYYKVQVQIQYKIKIIESLLLTTHLTDTYLNLIKSIFECIGIFREPQSNTDISIKFFYDLITKKTENMPKTTKPPLVSELDTDLLRFQATTVKWLLMRENMMYDDETRTVKENPIWNKSLMGDDDISKALERLVFGFKLIKIPYYDEEIWYNDYTHNICSKSKAIEFLSEMDLKLGGTGLLAEEMGLGKTVETVSLILLNQRPLKDINQQYFEYSLNRTVRKIKGTLIICPESILHQWVDEVELHAPCLSIMIYKGVNSSKKSSVELMEEMSKHDIILASYNTISRELHNALYNPSSRPKRARKTVVPQLLELELDSSDNIEPEALESLKGIYEQVGINQKMMRDREDHSSPLVMCEFWRVILDEVQMVGATVSNVCRIATMIPRFHSWGVSGTPIKNDLSDLSSIISYLKISPFGINNKKAWKSLVNRPDDFMKLFEGLSLRHTKEMVKNDISIPPQEKYLLSVPFGPIEQNNYEELYKQFLKEVSLDQNGNPKVEDWEPSLSYYEYMSFWLKKLRRVCCHANIGIDARVAENPSLQTMDHVLQDMIEKALDRANQLNRNITSYKIEIGQAREFEKMPKSALDIWMQELPNVEKRIHDLKNLTEGDKGMNPQNLRYNLDLLHRLYFFIASAHYQLYNPPLSKLVPGIDKDMVPADVDPELGGDEHISSSILVYRVLTKEESEHQELESEFYSKAQDVRKEVLADPIKNVSNTVKNLNPYFQLEYIQFTSEAFQSLDTQSFAISVGSVITQLNSQSQILNDWIKNLTKAISTPLLDGVTNPDGEEYGGSLDDQEKAAAYLDLLQRAIKDRNALIFGKNESGDFENIDAIVESSDSDFKAKLEEEYPKVLLENSLRYLVINSKTILAGLTVVQEMEPFSKIIVQARKILEEEKESLSALKKFFKAVNDCYNLRILYFRQLQELSDNVMPFDEISHANYNVKESIQKLTKKIETEKEQLLPIYTRIRYLRSLSSDEASDSDFCVVCRSTITIGSLTKCGHQYCKDCLDHWLARNTKCPICKEYITKIDVYHFTHNRDAINVRMVTDTEGKDGEIFQVYHKMDEDDLSDINSISIRNNFGSKVNTIVKQVLWLKKRDPSVQIIIYSQWTQLLQIIGSALRQNSVKYLGSKNTLSRIGQGRRTALKSDISQFKKDSSITCFLLNAKAEASGLTLVNATHVFLCEPLVNTALELQAISRIHRIGQKKPTSVWMFSITGSVEESIMLLATRKKVKEREKLDTEEMTKNFNKLVEANGEHVSESDLWNSFFSTKIDRVV